jgi:hypothetical protein
MRIRCIWVILAVVLVPAIAQAHIHNADASAALSFDAASTLVGGHTQVGVTFPRPRNRDLGLLLDVTIHHGEHEDRDVTRVGFMGGVRYMYQASDTTRFIPSGHVLVGLQHDAGVAGFKTDLAVAVGGALEITLTEDQDTGKGWGTRFLVDYVFSDVDNFPRISAGVVYRFGRQP